MLHFLSVLITKLQKQDKRNIQTKIKLKFQNGVTNSTKNNIFVTLLYSALMIM